MSNSSNLNGPSSIIPIPGGVWKIQKKRRTDDRKNQNHDNEYEESGKRKNKDTVDIKELEMNKGSTASGVEHEQPGTSAENNKKKNPRKVDLVI